MKKATVVCIEGDRLTAVVQLRELGIVHVVDVTPPASAELDSLREQLDHATHAAAVLAVREPEDVSRGEPPAGEPRETVATVLEALSTISQLQERRHQLHRAQAALEPWGSFDRAGIELIRAAGLQVVLAAAAEKKSPELPEGAVFHEISRKNKIVYFAVVAPQDVELELTSVSLPEITDLGEIDRQLQECERNLTECDARLDALADAEDSVRAYAERLKSDVQFVAARDGMGTTDRLAYLTGFVPASRLEELKAGAARHGWALHHDDADRDDPAVPTLLRVPKFFRLAEAIFDFIGILPGYHEVDVSISVLVFFSVFFGMIVGDAGYGALFLIIGIVARAKVKGARKQLAANLFLLLSAVTLTWGWLTGNFFAIPAERLPAFMQGWDVLAENPSQNRQIQWLCFFIGALHLSLARLWQAALRYGSRAALGQVGWGMLIWGNFFTAVELIVFKGSFPKFAYGLYGVGLGLILICGVNWRDAGEVFNLPFGFIGSFVDVLSYIRLFAVGLSSYFIARSFNDMGGMVFEITPWLLPAAAVVILFGHLLNVALAFLGVLVHGIRLNTLEFSNHMDLAWSGRPFTPLQKQADATVK